MGKEMQKSFTKRFPASVLKEQCNEGRIHSLSLLFPCFPAQVAHLQLPGNTPASHALHPCVSREKRGKKKKKRSCRGKIVLTSRERKLFAALPPLSPVLSAFHSALNLISPLCRPRVTGWALEKTPRQERVPRADPFLLQALKFPPGQRAPTGCCCHNKSRTCRPNLGQVVDTELCVFCSNGKSIFFTLLIIKGFKSWP